MTGLLIFLLLVGLALIIAVNWLWPDWMRGARTRLAGWWTVLVGFLGVFWDGGVAPLLDLLYGIVEWAQNDYGWQQFFDPQTAWVLGLVLMILGAIFLYLRSLTDGPPKPIADLVKKEE